MTKAMPTKPVTLPSSGDPRVNHARIASPAPQESLVLGNTYTRKGGVDLVWRAEWKGYLQTRWKGRKVRSKAAGELKPTTKFNLVGLALSGGGIRSATFNLGLLQALAKLKVLKYCDYLSTVSGGGYIGSCLLSHLRRKDTGLEGKQFPFAFPETGKERAEVRHLRNNSNYLAPERRMFGLDTWRLIASYLTGFLVVLPVTLALPIVAAGMLDYFSLDVTVFDVRVFQYLPLLAWAFTVLVLPIVLIWQEKANPSTEKANPWVVLFELLPGFLIMLAVVIAPLLTQSSGEFWKTEPVWNWAWPFPDCHPSRLPCWLIALGPAGLIRALLAAALLLSVLFLFSVGLRVFIKVKERPEVRKRFEESQAWILLLTVWMVLPALLPSLVEIWSKIKTPGWGEIGTWSTSLLALAVPLALNREWQKEWINRIKMPLIKAGAITFLLSTTLTLLVLYREDPIPAFTVSLCVLILSVAFLDLDNVSLHYLYRDRLTAAFIVKPSDHQPDLFVPRHDLKLSELSEPVEEREDFHPPYPLINATINVADDPETATRGRRGHLFQFSPLFCGSDKTGWQKTSSYQGGTLDLATAMAISGAAVSPQMGMYTSRPFAMLMTLFNVRLGSWLQNPLKFGLKGAAKLPKRDFWDTLMAELFGRASLESPYVLLSDGGHFDNLGLYGLIQRRCRYIIVSDAGADEKFSFADLGNALSKVRVDLGVQVDLDLSKLRPDPATGFSSSHCAVGWISYPGDEEQESSGILLYLRPTLSGKEPADLLTYRGEHPSFPNQTTADQFFNEAQFEAYRELGYQVTKKAF